MCRAALIEWIEHACRFALSGEQRFDSRDTLVVSARLVGPEFVRADQHADEPNIFVPAERIERLAEIGERRFRKAMDLSAAVRAEIGMVDEQRELLVLVEMAVEHKSRNEALLDLGKAGRERIEVEELHQPLRDGRHALSRR